MLLPSNYYLYLFAGVYALSPYINKGLVKLSQRQFQKLLGIMIFLFIVWSSLMNMVGSLLNEGTITNVFFTSMTGSSRGFNIVTFLTLYMVGAYIRIHVDAENKRNRNCAIMVMLLSTFLTSFLSLIFPRVSDTFYNYDSVNIVLSATAMVIACISLPMQERRFLNFAGRYTFGTFLLHGFASSILERFATIEETIRYRGIIPAVLIFVIGTYLLSLFLTVTLQAIAVPVSKRWKKSKLYDWRLY